MTMNWLAKSVRDIMTRDVVSIGSNELVRDALHLMTENRVAWLPVLDRNGFCVGVLSQYDLVALATDAEELEEDHDSVWGYELISADLFTGTTLSDITGERVEDVMSSEVVQIRPDDSVGDAIDRLVRHRIHHLPVCDDMGRLLGVVSTMDLLALLRTPVGT